MPQSVSQSFRPSVSPTVSQSDMHLLHLLILDIVSVRIEDFKRISIIYLHAIASYLHDLLGRSVGRSEF
jgi:hypothetical protein